MVRDDGPGDGWYCGIAGDGKIKEIKWRYREGGNLYNSVAHEVIHGTITQSRKVDVIEEI
ncbi:predicted protein [Sclerotinia sclerotiorum 1980 UF-70]|uniref:Uncharacterized protein n=1 Tax=Sclerotinia sclerotiorum (strain ATCC 18683 / 1980 / Ss-1) TaxID=665079 RepID=A7F0G1_SCLS1|nr:predicted protein [Sclerotinia sclerotiorum 1980 UF-70]EDN95203.1 predicted protein [Sclerotinia sclerotiorum 1980 UF-70]